jgi:hypothetical protein
VPTYQWQGYRVAIHKNVLTAKMALFFDHLPLKNARASYPISL